MNADPPGESPQGGPPGSPLERAGAEGRRTPSADEIEVPDWQLEEDEPPAEAGEGDSAGERGARRPHEAISGRLARRASGVLSVLDRLLLVIAIGGPLLILGYQSFEWLRTSQWPSMPVAEVLVWLQADARAIVAGDWQGLNRVLQWVLAMPLSLFLFVAGLLLHLVSGLVFPRAPRD